MNKPLLKAVNPALLKIKLSKVEIDAFRENLNTLIANIKKGSKEHEGHVETSIRDFLISRFGDNYTINKRGYIDFAIWNKSHGKVEVIIEVKRPDNTGQMPTRENINAKATQQLVWYFLNQRISEENLAVKHLIITNGFEWFLFDANVFDKLFAKNKELVRDFVDFSEKRTSSTSTETFYKEIAKPAIENVINDIDYTYFDLQKISDKELRLLLKIFTPEHLLKLPIANDSNSLNKDFYLELLHIIGLVEVKNGNKKLIRRNKEGERNPGALLENTIEKLDTKDKLCNLDNLDAYGDTKQDQLFNVGLELVITWVNRILFLKLLEAQLITYNKRDASNKFLTYEKIRSFSQLFNLFFAVLARKPDERIEAVRTAYSNVPYLNSSLFEPTTTEKQTIDIDSLDSEITLMLHSSTVLKDARGKKCTGVLSTLEYFFAFLDAYDFASDASEELKEDNKTLINASVLGLIFEKINGYQDGSFFTPSFITMYMCKETLRQAVLDKFNTRKGWKCKSFDQLTNHIDDLVEANEIVNSLKICDPAVGSGHFLVSALNELISIKFELGIWLDTDGKKIKKTDFSVSVINDELLIHEGDGEIFSYNPKNAESARIQKSLFHEKQSIIERCLFGVDVNPNSVKICRLRLWIELLKNAYYQNSGQLETLPNIDINIKVGNSLISRFSLDINIKDALKKSKLSLPDYKQAVSDYQNAKSKEAKQKLEKQISQIKGTLRSEVDRNSPEIISFNNAKGELTALGQQTLFDELPEQRKEKNIRKKKLEAKLAELEKKIEEIKNNKIFETAFEWRFEFPEVLNDDGEFTGFDVILGNPPYGVSITGKKREALVNTLGKVPDYEIYYWFINRARQLLRQHGQLAYIIPNSILFNVYAQSYRLEILNNWTVDELLDCTEFDIFSDAAVRNIVFRFTKGVIGNSLGYRETINTDSFQELLKKPMCHVDRSIVEGSNQNWGLIFKTPANISALILKIKQECTPLEKYFPETSQGLIAYDKYAGQSEETIKGRIFHSTVKHSDEYKSWLNGEDVTRYSVKWNAKEYLNYCDGIANPRKPTYFRGERILIREITNPSIYAGYTQDELYFDPSVIVVMNNSESPMTIFTLLGILNSKLATFYHFNASPKATKGAFPKILVYDINNFPLPRNIENNIQFEIQDNVKKVLTQKKKNPAINTAILEEDIERLVYKLYNLTKEEIDLIEGYRDYKRDEKI